MSKRGRSFNDLNGFSWVKPGQIFNPPPLPQTKKKFDSLFVPNRGEFIGIDSDDLRLIIVVSASIR